MVNVFQVLLIGVIFRIPVVLIDGAAETAAIIKAFDLDTRTVNEFNGYTAVCLLRGNALLDISVFVKLLICPVFRKMALNTFLQELKLAVVRLRRFSVSLGNKNLNLLADGSCIDV